jgi:hypothetical protein
MESSEIFAEDTVELDSTLPNHVKKTAKGKLKWSGDFESLQAFIKKSLGDFNGKWMSPRGGCKELKHPSIILRWYVESQSLILDGEQADVVKDKLFSSAQQNQEILDEMTSDEESDIFHNDNDDSGGEGKRSQHPSHSHNDLLHDYDNCIGGEEERSQHISLLEETVKTLRKEIIKIQEDFEINNERTNNLLSRLTSKVTSLYELRLDEGENNPRPRVVELIQNENSALKNENEFLTP